MNINYFPEIYIYMHSIFGDSKMHSIALLRLIFPKYIFKVCIYIYYLYSAILYIMPI